MEETLARKAGIVGQSRDTREEAKSFKIKPMIAPTARDAPRFSSKRPQELRRFLRWMEDLWKGAGIEDDQEKKESLGKYADQDSEEEWKALENYPPDFSWEDYRKELIENYPEAAEAERGTPARMRQICRETRDIRLGDLPVLYSFRRQFMAEAKKLSKDPPAMSNRELVELFIGSLAPSFTAAVLQFLGNKAEQKQKTTAGQTGQGEFRRLEDRYDLEDICKAAVQVSENAGMFPMINIHEIEPEGVKRSTKLNQFQLQPAADTNKLVQKLESLESVQALERDKMDMVSKNLDSKFTALEDMMKSMMSQVQNGARRDQVPQYDPNSGVRLGQAGTIPRWGPSSDKNHNHEGDTCFYCGGKGHYVPECEVFKGDLKAGKIKLNGEGKMRMPDGAYVPNFPNGATIKERIERYNMKKQNQFYCGYDENDEIPEVAIPRYPTQFVNTVEDPTQRLARMALQLNQREQEALELKKMKLEREDKKKEEASRTTKTAHLLDLMDRLEQEEGPKLGFL